MNGWLVYDKTSALDNVAYIEWFIEEATKQSIQLELIYRESLHTGVVNGEHHILLHEGVFSNRPTLYRDLHRQKP